MGLISQVVNGLGLGSICTLVTLGYSMVCGIVQLTNFAYGDAIMVGAYAIFLLLAVVSAPLRITVLGSILFCVVAGAFIKRVTYRHLINIKTPRISLLIMVAGVGIFLRDLSQSLFTSSDKTIPSMFGLNALEAGAP